MAVHHAVGLYTEWWEHFAETRADLEATYARTGLLADTPPGVAVEVEHSTIAE